MSYEGHEFDSVLNKLLASERKYYELKYSLEEKIKVLEKALEMAIQQRIDDLPRESAKNSQVQINGGIS